MIKEVRIEKYEDLMPLFSEQMYQDNIGRWRSSFIYRGMGKTSYKMETSLKRNCKSLQNLLEPEILKNFKKFAILEDPAIEKSVWNQMMAGQHHGLPTRLLDFTHSPLIALQFAAVNNIEDNINDDCMVWRLDVAELHNLLPQKYKTPIKGSQSKIYTIDMLNQVVHSISEYDADMENQSMVIFEPSSIDQRIITQYSFFGIIPTEMDDIEAFLDKYTNNTVKYIISKDLRWQIADNLDAMGISERILYPGLDGLSKWIARHYYVKD